MILFPRPEDPRPQPIRLTDRQAEVLIMLCKYCDTTEQIALVLGCASRTVDAHLQDLFREFRVNSKIGLLRLAMKHPEGCSCEAIYCSAMRASLNGKEPAR